MRRLLPRGLSGRLLLLTAAFVLVAEVLIFVPSVANFRLAWLQRHFAAGEAIARVLETVEEDARGAIAASVLDLTATDLIAVRRAGASRVLAVRPDPPLIVDEVARIDVGMARPGALNAVRFMGDGLQTLFGGGDRSIRVFGPLSDGTGTLDLVTHEAPLREAMLVYARNVAWISLAVSALVASLVFLALRWLVIRPVQRVQRSIERFANDPQDAGRIIQPSNRRDEVGAMEAGLKDMQTRVSETFRQRERLAALGLAVSKINHDLRNILSSAILFSDRLTTSADPAVQRLAPKLLRNLERATDYTQAVMTYGRAGEATPEVRVVDLYSLAEEVATMLPLADPPVDWANRVPKGLEAQADPEQIFRVLLNLSRNAVQAMSAISDGYGAVRRLEIDAERTDDALVIEVIDTGPGIREGARETLFGAFQGSTSKGGTGLGLAIAAEIVHAHGGQIELRDEGAPGCCFRIVLPQSATLTKRRASIGEKLKARNEGEPLAKPVHNP